MGFNVMPTFALRSARGTNRRLTAPALAVVLAPPPTGLAQPTAAATRPGSITTYSLNGSEPGPSALAQTARRGSLPGLPTTLSNEVTSAGLP